MPSPVRIDYIVIGSGVAGLTAALELGKHGYVAILTKSKISDSATSYAQGGIASAFAADDSTQLHFEDTIKAGDGLCDEAVVKILTQEGPDRIKDLIENGAIFDKNGDALDLSREAAHSRRRVVHAKDSTGREVVRALTEAIYKMGTISFFSQTTVLKLLISDNRAVGCLALWKNMPMLFYCKAVVVASGGFSHLFYRSTHPLTSTGDGISLAFDAGCTLQDMEFVQFHPTALFVGKRPEPSFLISETIRGEGAELRNILGERFMPHYHPDAELAPRDVVTRAIFFECQKTQSDFVYLNTHTLNCDVKNRFPGIYQRCLELGMDITKVPIPVSPSAHYTMGGIRTDEWGFTGLHGLYAVGEVASLGLHGANRLASNSLLEGLVFGHRAALHAANTPDCEVMVLSSSDSFLDIAEISDDKARPILALKDLIREGLWSTVGIVREQESLTGFLNHLAEHLWVLDIQTHRQDITEIKHLILVAHLVTSAALKRQESRGSHFRSDFPARNDTDWRHHILQTKG
jgi:L-aspartate oxidase